MSLVALTNYLITRFFPQHGTTFVQLMHSRGSFFLRALKQSYGAIKLGRPPQEAQTKPKFPDQHSQSRRTTVLRMRDGKGIRVGDILGGPIAF